MRVCVSNIGHPHTAACNTGNKNADDTYDKTKSMGEENEKEQKTKRKKTTTTQEHWIWKPK